MNEATIGRFTWDGIEYEIDWPFDFEDETVRSGFGAIYRDGDQSCYCHMKYTKQTSGRE